MQSQLGVLRQKDIESADGDENTPGLVKPSRIKRDDSIVKVLFPGLEYRSIGVVWDVAQAAGQTIILGPDPVDEIRVNAHAQGTVSQAIKDVLLIGLDAVRQPPILVVPMHA